MFCFLLLSCCCRDKIELYIHPFVSHNANVFWVLMLHTTTAGIAAGDETELEAAHTGTCVRTNNRSSYTYPQLVATTKSSRFCARASDHVAIVIRKSY